jgi:hypothetical protein
MPQQSPSRKRKLQRLKSQIQEKRPLSFRQRKRLLRRLRQQLLLRLNRLPWRPKPRLISKFSAPRSLSKET